MTLFFYYILKKLYVNIYFLINYPQYAIINILNKYIFLMSSKNRFPYFLRRVLYIVGVGYLSKKLAQWLKVSKDDKNKTT